MKIEYPAHGEILLTNSNGDTLTVTNEEAYDFLSSSKEKHKNTAIAHT